MSDDLHSTAGHNRPFRRIPAQKSSRSFRSGNLRTWPMRAVLALVLAISLTGCITPIGVRKVPADITYREITANALGSNALSHDSQVVLYRFGLLERFYEDPAAIIALLHEKASQDPRRDLRFALAEMSYYYGTILEKRGIFYPNWAEPYEYYLMSAVYSYYYLFGESGKEQGDPYDRRFQIAVDMYNRALGKGLATGKDGELVLQDETRLLPVGDIEISLKLKALPWPMEDFDRFLPADDYAVYGFSIMARTPGIGAPLIAVHKKTPEYPGGPSIPMTAFLRVPGDVQDLNDKTVRASLELYSGYKETTIVANGQKVPLGTDTTTPLAYRLSDSYLWSQLGPRRFIFGGQERPKLIMLQPYGAGRIPVVFIHGTASNPLWWAEMFNTLYSDPVLQDKFQFWFFLYDSNLRVPISAAALRDILTETVTKLDPERKDPALQEMVLVGHSQGGLLEKMSVVDTGDKLWNAITDVSLKDLKAKPELKKELQKEFFIEPLPFVKRVVFISTPHHGSFRASSWVRTILRRIVTLPGDILSTNPKEYFNFLQESKIPSEARSQVLTSVDSMSPDNPVLKALAGIPVAPGIKSHSIIAVLPEYADYKEGNDGVVNYSSAHIDGVESEFIVRDQHSCQGNPAVIEEVRRILLEHLTSVSESTGKPEAALRRD
jgi:pimeloyl-ACP methyl ester carboxylesterase